MSPNAVKLKLPRGMKIHDIVNISQVKPYKEQLPRQPAVRPGPVDITDDRDKVHKVDYLVDVTIHCPFFLFLEHPLMPYLPLCSFTFYVILSA